MFKIIILFILISGISPVMADEDMISSLICPCECAMVISTCDCPTAIQVKKEISSMKEAGFSEKQIASALQVEYGSGIFAHPKANSTPPWVIGIPLALILVFLGYVMARRPNTNIIPIPDRESYEKRFEEEYQKFVSEFEGCNEHHLYGTGPSKMEEM